MSSRAFQLSNRSRRLLWRNQHKEYEESIASHTKLPPSTRWRNTSSTWIRLWDPVAFLPLELAVMCLRLALPSGNDYPAALIELTSVSTTWQDLLFSVPHLWTTIHVRYSAPDLMAIISLFLHLSAEAPLNLIVWNTPGSAWEGIRSLLMPHIYRIHSLALGDDPPIYHDSPYVGAAYMSLASDIFISLGQPPGLVELDLGRTVYVHPSQLKALDLPSGISISNAVKVYLRDTRSVYNSLSLFLGKKMGRNDPYSVGMLIVEPDNTGFSRWLPMDSQYYTNYIVSYLNSNISFLADVLNSLGYPETRTRLSASSSQMTFTNASTNSCYLCDMRHRSLSRALGCARSHFGFRPFQCPGCRTCNAKKGCVIDLFCILLCCDVTLLIF
jgi:hypothetical protein